MAERTIPDRSAEPALQESLDHGPKSKTAANSNDVEPDAPPETRDDEGNSTEQRKPDAAVTRKPPAEKVKEQTGVPAESEELSTL